MARQENKMAIKSERAQLINSYLWTGDSQEKITGHKEASIWDGCVRLNQCFETAVAILTRRVCPRGSSDKTISPYDRVDVCVRPSV